MLISVRHVTRYRYAEPVTYTIQSLRLTPASFTGQRVVDWQVADPFSDVVVTELTQRGRAG